jgi:predicted outer membrane repeat protein
MSRSSWLSLALFRSNARLGERRNRASRPIRARLVLEQLDHRVLPANYTAASVSALIADMNSANASGGANTITLTAATTTPYVLTALAESTLGAGPVGLPVIAANDNLTIVGGGDTIERSTTSGTPDFGLFFVALGASLTLQSLTLQGGDTYQGGAVSNVGALTLNGVLVQDNIAWTDGGGIYSDGGSVTLEGDSIVQDNTADGASGAGADYYTDIPGYGGGIYAQFCTVTVTNATLNNNKAGVLLAGGYGGGIYAVGATVTMSNATLAKNSSGDGGGLCLGVGGGATLTNCTVQGNSAGQGGGVYDYDGSLTLDNDTVESNSASTQGGGIFVEANLGSYSATLTNCTLEENSAGESGGALFVDRGNVDLVNDTVKSNSVLSGLHGVGGGIYICALGTLDLDSFTLANTINNKDHSGLNGSTANIDGKYALLS